MFHYRMHIIVVDDDDDDAAAMVNDIDHTAAYI